MFQCFNDFSSFDFWFVRSLQIEFSFECLLRLTLNTIEDLCVPDLWIPIGVRLVLQKGKLSVSGLCVSVSE